MLYDSPKWNGIILVYLSRNLLAAFLTVPCMYNVHIGFPDLYSYIQITSIHTQYSTYITYNITNSVTVRKGYFGEKRGNRQLYISVHC